jgi:hypothetical protein
MRSAIQPQKRRSPSIAVSEPATCAAKTFSFRTNSMPKSGTSVTTAI